MCHCLQELHREQTARIKELEREVVAMRVKHSEAIQQLKTDFLQQKKDYEQESDAKLNTMAKQATQVRTSQCSCRLLISVFKTSE